MTEELYYIDISIKTEKIPVGSSALLALLALDTDLCTGVESKLPGSNTLPWRCPFMLK